MMGIALRRFNLFGLLQLVLFACLLGKQSSVLGLTLTLGLGDVQAEESAAKRAKIAVSEGQTALAYLKQIQTKQNQQGLEMVQVQTKLKQQMEQVQKKLTQISTNLDTLLGRHGMTPTP